MPSVLITGASGMLGSVVGKFFANAGWNVTQLVRRQKHDTAFPTLVVDLADSEQIRSQLAKLRFDACIHCAAITDLHYCQTHPETATLVHVNATRTLVSLLHSARFVYISTDSVFDGTGSLYCESDECRPLNHYAVTKWQGELETLKHANAAVIRTNIYDIRESFQTSLAEWAASALSRKKKISGFTNVFFNPLHTVQLSEAILALLTSATHFKGVLHVAADRVLSKYDFLLAVARQLNLPTQNIQKGYYDQTEKSLQRPLNTSLATALCKSVLPQLSFSLEEGIANLQLKAKHHAHHD